jgi:glycosyltransferase involved in cell wall biosynthesis
LLVSLHGADLVEAAASTGFERGLWRLLLGTADKLILCSETLKPRLASTITTAPGRVSTITPGVDIAHLLEIALNEPTTSLPSMFIYSVGTYERKKGHDVLIDAFELIAAALPEVWLIIAGRRAEPEFSATALRQQRSIAASRILLLTDVPHRELIAIMSRATVFALPSRDEPFGIVVLEAGALKIPVVATDVCGAAKNLKASFHAEIVQPDDAQSLANSLMSLLKNKARSAQMGTNLYDYVYAHNSWEASAQLYGALIERITTR